ncbi:MAG: putative short-subunit dehydrogenase-like oxidoreductase (DUF2520 family) [Myxococcota bacterium]
MDVAIVGPGRLGRSLALLLAAEGIAVTLCGRGEAPPAGIDVVLLTVPDSAISDVASAIRPGPVVLHCSGASPIDVLDPHVRRGSLHPLMSFPGPEHGVPPLAGVGAAVAGHPDAVSVARRLCSVLGMTPISITGDRRLYHAAAVIAGNFTTVLMAEATRLLIAAGADPQTAAATLAPLAHASVDGAVPDPAAGLTGPVTRGDRTTIRGHQVALDEAGLGDLRRLYDALTARAEAIARKPTVCDGVVEDEDRPVSP